MSGVDTKKKNKKNGLCDEALQEMEEEFAARLGEADDTIAALRAERDDLRAELSSSAKGGDANAALLREKTNQLADYKNELEASARKNGELEGTVRKLQLNLKDFKQENDRMVNRMRLHDETAAKAAEEAAAKEASMAEEIRALRQRIAAEGHDRDEEVLDLRQRLAAAAARAQESVGREAKRALDAAEERALAAEADAAQLRANISEIEAGRSRGRALRRGGRESGTGKGGEEFFLFLLFCLFSFYDPPQTQHHHVPYAKQKNAPGHGVSFRTHLIELFASRLHSCFKRIQRAGWFQR